MLHIPGDAEAEPPPPPPARHASAAEAVGEETLSAAVDLPWDDWLGVGASDRVRDGSLGLVRVAYGGTAARDMRRAADPAGMLRGDAADRERLGAIALAVAAAHARPARMPHQPGEEPHAWWVADERTLVWMPWADLGEAPYGLDLLERGEADAVVVAAPDACWTVFRTGVPRRGARGTWDDLPERYRSVCVERLPGEVERLRRGARWRRDGDTLVVRWRDGDDRLRSVSVTLRGPRVARQSGRRQGRP